MASSVTVKTFLGDALVVQAAAWLSGGVEASYSYLEGKAWASGFFGILEPGIVLLRVLGTNERSASAFWQVTVLLQPRNMASFCLEPRN